LAFGGNLVHLGGIGAFWVKGGGVLLMSLAMEGLEILN